MSEPTQKKIKSSKTTKVPVVQEEKLQVANLCQYKELNTLIGKHSNPNDESSLISLSEDEQDAIRNWLPTTHVALFDLALDWSQSKADMPTCAAAILGILLEHALRLEWCQVNQRPRDEIARQGAYYVTLDGHGQRHVHDLLLHPYCSKVNENDNEEDNVLSVAARREASDKDENNNLERNRLIERLGGGTVALLTDLFLAASGDGPNIRAAIAHGLWDDMIREELISSMAQSTTNEQEGQQEQQKEGEDPLANINATDKNKLDHIQQARKELIRQCVHLMLVALKACAMNQNLPYRPVFSFTATTQRHLQEALFDLQTLQQSANVEHKSNAAMNQLTRIASTITTDSVIQDEIKAIFMQPNGDDGWTANDFYQEIDTNLLLSDCIAARVLIQDIATAAQQFNQQRQQHQEQEQQEGKQVSSTLSRRQGQARKRLKTLAPIAHAFYTFCLYTAVLYISKKQQNSTPLQQQDLNLDLLHKAVLRSRMCLSTFSTFVPVNSERALKAVNEYLKGKATKAILSRIEKKCSS